MGTQDGFPITELRNLTSAETLCKFQTALASFSTPALAFSGKSPNEKKAEGFIPVFFFTFPHRLIIRATNNSAGAFF